MVSLCMCKLQTKSIVNETNNETSQFLFLKNNYYKNIEPIKDIKLQTNFEVLPIHTKIKISHTIYIHQCDLILNNVWWFSVSQEIFLFS